jgi:hypothetical protein
VFSGPSALVPGTARRAPRECCTMRTRSPVEKSHEVSAPFDMLRSSHRRCAVAPVRHIAIARVRRGAPGTPLPREPVTTRPDAGTPGIDAGRVRASRDRMRRALRAAWRTAQLTANHMRSVQLADERFGTDVLVNNAGIMSLAPIAETSDDVFELTIAVNLRGPFLLGGKERGSNRGDQVDQSLRSSR